MKRLFWVCVWMSASTCARADITDGTFLGPALRWQALYDGSATFYAQPFPLLRDMGKHLFVRSTEDWLEGGSRYALAPELHAGVQLAIEPGRDSTRSPFLTVHHVAGIDRGVSVGTHLEWDHSFGPMPVSGLLRLRQRMGQNAGTQLDARLSAGLFQWGRVAGGGYIDLTWADASSINHLYGVRANTAAALTLPSYQQGAAWLYSNSGLGVGFDFTPHWSLAAAGEWHRLMGQVHASPLVQQTNNVYWTLGLIYVY